MIAHPLRAPLKVGLALLVVAGIAFGVAHRRTSAYVNVGRWHPGPQTIERHWLLEQIARIPSTPTARFVPSVDCRGRSSVRVYAIRAGSLPDRLGLRNGDRITRVNGLPPYARANLLALRTSPYLLLDVERNGRPVQLAYALR